jgi:hypothetical protein
VETQELAPPAAALAGACMAADLLGPTCGARADPRAASRDPIAGNGLIPLQANGSPTKPNYTTHANERGPSCNVSKAPRCQRGLRAAPGPWRAHRRTRCRPALWKLRSGDVSQEPPRCGGEQQLGGPWLRVLAPSRPSWVGMGAWPVPEWRCRAMPVLDHRLGWLGAHKHLPSPLSSHPQDTCARTRPAARPQACRRCSSRSRRWRS